MTKQSLFLLPLLFSFVIFIVSPAYAQAPRRAQESLNPDEVPSTRAATMRSPKPATGSAVRERVASKSGMLKERLAQFKDRRKATIVERIATNLTNVNQRRTSQMMQQVDTLMTILKKAEDRVVAMQAAGSDVSAINTELGLSKTALANAKTAVDEQSKKNYEIQVSTESGVKADVKETRDQLEQDLKATHSLVKESRRILINSLIKMSQLMGGGTATNESQ